GVDGAGRHAGGVERAHPVSCRSARENLLHLLLERLTVSHAVGVLPKARIVDPLRSSERPGAALPELLGSRSDHEIAILRGNTLVGGVLTVASTLTPRLLSVDQPCGTGPAREAEGGLEERAVNLLPLPGALPFIKGSQDPLHTPHASAEIADRLANRC